VLILTALLLGVPAAAVAEALPTSLQAQASVLDPQARFNEAAARWRERYDQRMKDKAALLKSLAGTPAAKDLARHFKGAVEFHQGQLKLYRSLVKNQKEALADGVIARDVYDRHIARLDRMMNERLLNLWGGILPSRWNTVLSKLPKGSRPPGIPVDVYPSESEYRRFQLKDHTPIYEKEKKIMRVIRPDEGLQEEPGEKKP
jgi:hypothetical protein